MGDFPDVAASLLHLDAYLDGPVSRSVGVAVSGGGDSIALLLLMHLWGRRPLEVFCVDHGLNPLSADWTRGVEALCARIGVSFTPLHWVGEKPSTGLSAAARMARHRLIAEAMRAKNIGVTVWGHNADDGLEAALMREQGSQVGSPRLWAPSPLWPEGRGQAYLRPLVDVRRARLRAWLDAVGVGYIDDPANENPASLRARVRREMDASTPSTLKTARPEITVEDLNAVLIQPETYEPWGAFRVDKAALLTHPALLTLLSHSLVCAGGGAKLPRLNALNALVSALKSSESGHFTLCGARVTTEGETVLITRDTGDIGRRGVPEIPIKPQQTIVYDGRFVVTTEALGGHLRPLHGVISHLEAGERQKILQIPALVRSSLPVLTIQESHRLCVPPVAHMRSLVYRRLYAALGLYGSEAVFISPNQT